MQVQIISNSSTCHVILEEGLFDSIPEAVDEEEDMLDLAYGL